MTPSGNIASATPPLVRRDTQVSRFETILQAERNMTRTRKTRAAAPPGNVASAGRSIPFLGLWITIVLVGCGEANRPLSPLGEAASTEVLLPSLVVNTTPFIDDFETAAVGSLPADYALTSGGPSVQSGPQLDGTTGQFLEFAGSGVNHEIELTTAGTRDDLRIEWDHRDRVSQRTRIMFRATDPANGYAFDTFNGIATLIRLNADVPTVLAVAVLPPAVTATDGWRRYRIEAEGSALRVASEKGLVMKAEDGNYTSGEIFITTAGGVNGPVAVDNISVTSTPSFTAGTTSSLPFSTGFEEIERTTRNGALQPQALEIVRGGVTYMLSEQMDGSNGSIMEVPSVAGQPSIVKVLTDPLGDLRVSVSLRSRIQSEGRIYIRASDPNNGYVFDVTNGLGRLWRVDSGTPLLLASAPVIASGSGDTRNGWRRITIETEGSEIRVGDGGGMFMRVEDGTYASGHVFIGGESHLQLNHLRSMAFDDLVVEDSPLFVPATPTNLPYATGLESSERTHRNGTLQPPNLEILRGGVGYIDGEQMDGTTGTVMEVATIRGNPATVEVVTAPVADVRVAVNIRSRVQSSGRIYVRATDTENGYMLDVANGVGQLWRLDSGTPTLLARAHALKNSPGEPREGWRRWTVEAEGSELRVGDGGGLVIRVSDDTYASGRIFVEGESHLPLNHMRVMAFDDLSLDLDPVFVAATPAAVPYITGLEASERSERNATLQPPALEVTRGGVSYLEGTQRDGTTGTIMEVAGVGTTPSTVRVMTAPLEETRIQLDIRSRIQANGRVFFRATDPDNGYLLEAGGGQTLVLYRVTAGTRTVLASTVLPLTDTGASGWRRFTIDAEGSEIRVGSEQGAVIRVQDATYADGFVFLEARSTLPHKWVRDTAFDNLTVNDSPVFTPATPASLPLSTGFETAERIMRNGALQFESMELLDGAVAYRDGSQLDGSTGTVVELAGVAGMPSTLQIAGPAAGDIQFAMDIRSQVQSVARMYFRAKSRNDGYLLEVGGLTATLYAVVGGTRTQLAQGTFPGIPGVAGWRRFVIEALGESISVKGPSLSLSAADATWSSGSVMLEGEGSLGWPHARVMAFDNLHLAFLTPEAATEAARALVEALVDAGDLTPDEGMELVEKLDQILEKLGLGQLDQVTNKVDQFIRKVENFVERGRLTPGQGDELIVAVERILALLPVS